jgi:prepilin-type N-terminal cleavage/methylation domain-containing protein
MLPGLLLRRLRRRARRDDGFTLAEMLTVTSLMGIIFAIAFTAMIQAQTTVRGNASRLDQTQQAKLAMDAMTRTLRTAVLPSQIGGGSATTSAFVEGRWNKVSFFANVNNEDDLNGPSKATYELTSTGDVVETIQPSSGKDASTGEFAYCTVGAVGCKVSTRTIARKVVYDPTKPLFTYYSVTDVDGLPLPLDAATLPTVNSMDVNVSIKVGKDVVASTVVTRVSLPNANAKYNNSDDS